jgi:hypothetical protein
MGKHKRSCATALEEVCETSESLEKKCFERTSLASAGLRARIRSSKYFKGKIGFVLAGSAKLFIFVILC